MSDFPLGAIYAALAVICLILLLTIRLVSGDRPLILTGFLLVLGRASVIAALGSVLFGMIQRFTFGDNWVVTVANAIAAAFVGGLFALQLFILALRVAEDRYGPKQGQDYV